jgi:hypothetical protein
MTSDERRSIDAPTEVAIPLELSETRSKNATQRDTRAGFDLFRSTGGAVSVDDLNGRLLRGGYAPVSLRTYNHYRKLVQAGYTRYVSINRLDVARASAPYDNASGNGRYSYRAADLAVSVLFAKPSKVLEAAARAVEIGDVGALLSFDDPVALAGLRSVKPQPGGQVAVRYLDVGRTVDGRIVEADVQAATATVEIEFTRLVSIADLGAADALPMVETRLTLHGPPGDAGGTVDELNRRLYHLLELLEGFRALANRAGDTAPGAVYAAPPLLSGLVTASPPDLVIGLAGEVTALVPTDRATGVLAASGQVADVARAWRDGGGDPERSLGDLQVAQRRLALDLHQREAELTSSVLERIGRILPASALPPADAALLVNAHVLPPLRALGGLGVTAVTLGAGDGRS